MYGTEFEVRTLAFFFFAILGMTGFCWYLRQRYAVVFRRHSMAVMILFGILSIPVFGMTEGQTGLELIYLCLWRIPLLAVISETDRYCRRIPDELTLSLGILGISEGVLRAVTSGEGSVWAACGLICWRILAVAGPLAFLYWVRRGSGLGAGDVKLMAAAACYLGVEEAWAAILWGSLPALIIEGFRAIRQGTSREFAYGPYLCLGILMVSWP